MLGAVTETLHSLNPFWQLCSPCITSCGSICIGSCLFHQECPLMMYYSEFLVRQKIIISVIPRHSAVKLHNAYQHQSKLSVGSETASMETIKRILQTVVDKLWMKANWQRAESSLNLLTSARPKKNPCFGTSINRLTPHFSQDLSAEDKWTVTLALYNRPHYGVISKVLTRHK